MNYKYLLKELDFGDYEFEANDIILSNNIIYDNYFYQPNWSGKFAFPDTVPTQPGIYHSDNIKLKGYFVFNSNKLLDNLLLYFNKLIDLCSDEEIKDYIKNKAKDADFDRRLGDIYKYSKFHKAPNSQIINLLINFFTEYGLPNTDYLSIIKIKYTILPKIIILSFLNTLYEDITLLSTDDVTDNYDIDILENKFNKIVFVINLLLNQHTSIKENNFDIQKMDLYINDYKIYLLDTLNRLTTFFGPVNLYSYIDFSEEQNKSIPLSNDIFSIAWYLIISKIQASFKKGKFKKCEQCR